MPIAGHLAIASVASTSSAPHLTFDGCTSFDLSDGTDMLDTSHFAGSRLRQKLAGLRDISGSFDINLNLTDPAYVLLRLAYTNGVAIHPRVLVDGTNGIQFPALVSSIARNGSVEDQAKVTISFENEGSYDPVLHGSGM